MKGRQLLWYIKQYFYIAPDVQRQTDIDALRNIELGRNDDVETFLCDWEHKLNQIQPPPSDKNLEHWLYSKLKDSPRLSNLVDNYTTNAIVNQNNRSYIILWKTVQSFLVNKRLDRT